MRVLIVLCALVGIAFAIDCHEEDPAYCARNTHLCHAKGFEDMMKKVCPIHCGYCSAELTMDPVPMDLDLDMLINDANIDVLEGCKIMFGECMRSAHLNPIRMIQCAGQFAVCSAMKLVSCSKECIPPMMKCHIDAIGDWGATFKCCAEFIKCAIGGCIHGNEALPELTMDSEPLMKSVMALNEDSSTNDCILDACKVMFHECFRSAGHNPFRMLKCAAQFTVCSAMKLVDCAKTCIAPAMKCHIDAIGDWRESMKCCADFIGCAIGGCTQSAGGALPELTMDPEAEMKSVMALNKDSPTNECILEACKVMFHECFRSAGHNPFRMAKCAGQFAVCSAMKLVGCAKECIAPAMRCHIDAIGDWRQSMKCCADFIGCAIGGCTQAADEPLPELTMDGIPTETDMDVLNFEANIDVLEGCKIMFGECMRASHHNPIRMIQCAGQFAVCSAMKLVGCSKECIPPMMKCHIDAIGDWGATFRCCADFIKCAIGGCIQNENERPTPSFSIEDNSEEVAQDLMLEEFSKALPDNDVVKECKMMLDECNNLADGKLERLKCFIEFGLCVGAKVANCSKQCVPPLIQCKIEAIKAKSFPAFIKCSQDFIACVIGGCVREKSLAITSDPYLPYQLAVDSAALYETDPNKIASIQECQEAHAKCVAAAGPGVAGKAKCFLKFGWCIAKHFTGCSAPCLPAMAICMMGATGNWVKTLFCATTFVKCVKSHCVGDSTELAISTTALEKTNVDIIKVIKECMDAKAACEALAPPGIPHKVVCYLKCGYCLGKQLAVCAAPCMPKMAICMMGASGNWMKTLMCATTFIKCSKDSCTKYALEGRI